MADGRQFPSISPGGSLLLAWQLRGRRVLIVGGGSVASDRLRSVLTADAKVTLVCPSAGLCAEVRHRLEQESQWGIVYHDRDFKDADLEDPDLHMVLTAIDDPAASTHIYTLCHQKRLNVNVADVPPEADFWFGSVIKRGPLQVMVSTGGKGPRIANRVRRLIEAQLPPDTAEAIENVGRLRAQLRKRAPDHADGKRRMEWMVRVCDKWTLAQLAAMDQTQIDAILDGWDSDVAKGPWNVRRAGFFSRFSIQRCPWWQGLGSETQSLYSGVTGFVLGLALASVTLLRVRR